MKVRNTFIIFLVSGFWHGANWTFVAWGGLNALYFLPYMLFGKNRNNMGIVAEGRMLPSAEDAVKIFVTFLMSVFAWIFFRAESMEHAMSFIRGLFFNGGSNSVLGMGAFIIAILLFQLIVFDWRGRAQDFALAKPFKNSIVDILVLLLLVGEILVFRGHGQTFIYFQF